MAANNQKHVKTATSGNSRGALRRLLKNLRRGRLLWRFESFRDFREVMEPGLRWSDLSFRDPEPGWGWNQPLPPFHPFRDNGRHE